MEIKQTVYEMQAEGIIEKLNHRGMEGYYCATKEEALEKVKRFLTPDSSVTWGGTETMKEIGLMEALKTMDCELLDRSKAQTEEERRAFYGQAVQADYFLMSTNAITLNGELVNIDGSGNRVACLCHGPKNVIVVAGINKIVTDVDSAFKRIRKDACPPNAVRLQRKTPCGEYGRCAECLNDDCMCCQMVVTRKSTIPGRIKVILVGESLGY